MSDRKRKLSDSTTQEYVFCNKLTKRTSSPTDTSLHTDQGSQQSSYQSAGVTDSDITSLPIGEKFQLAASKTMQSDEVDDGISLFDVLNTIGATGEYRNARQKAGITGEILESFQYPITFYNMGSTIEGTAIPGATSDRDVIHCDIKVQVIEDKLDAINNNEVVCSLLMLTEIHTPAGYVKLQLINEDMQNTSENWTIFWENKKHLFKTDINKRMFLAERLESADTKSIERIERKPADLTVGEFSGLKTDIVIAYRGNTWPTMANEWILRVRKNGWPTKETIAELISLEFFVVKKGHPSSPDRDLEWRISFSLQERQLMFNLTDVQYKSYVTLKMINRDVINFDCITTYHWKTCLFYTIEKNNGIIWEKKLLWYCITLCIKQMLKWVKCGFCPNYFIPGENLFDGRLNSSNQLKSEKRLEKILKLGFDCLRLVKKNNISDYMKSRESPECLQQLRENSTIVYKKALCTAEISIIEDVLSVFNHRIQEHFSFEANNNTFCLICLLWNTLNCIQQICASSNTDRETQTSLSLLIPHICTCLAGNISAIAIQQSNPQIRNFLFLGSFLYFFKYMKDDLPSYLRFISVLYAEKLYNDCEWWIDKLNENDVKNTPSMCRCRYIDIDQVLAQTNILNAQPISVSTCVSFLPTEFLITPDAIKFEMFKFFGISLNTEERSNVYCRWHYRTVIDSNIYFFLLKYLIKKKLGKVHEYGKAKHNILKLIEGTNVRHRDVTFNVLAWIFYSEYDTHDALLLARTSWWAMVLADTYFEKSLDNLEIKHKQKQYNASKIHALVILYKTWFARIPSSFHVCFHCLSKSETRLKHCSRCKVSTYCDEQCQRKNWKIHKKTCKMARKYHILNSTSVVPFDFL